MGLISVVTLVYNADSLLFYALSPMMPYVDEVVIVNGSPDGPSTDLSEQIIEKLDSPKVKYFDGIFGDNSPENNWDIIQHNFAFEHCTGDWVWKVDSDEIYDGLAVKEIINACQYADGYDYLRWLNLYFVRDTNHIRYVPPPIRCWRNELRELPQFHDLSVTPIVDGTHIQVTRKGRWLPNVATYHYGFILPYRRQFQRIGKFILREDNEDAKARPRVYTEGHLRDAWGTETNQIMCFEGYQPEPIKRSLFYNHGQNLTNLTFGFYTTGKYNCRDDVGGSELSLALCLNELDKRGVEYKINPTEPVDVLVVFREPIIPPVNAIVNIWWTCDQYVEPELQQKVKTISEHYDLIFAISQFHKDYLISIGVDGLKIKVTNLGIDRDEYEGELPKNINQLIYCSQPDRGLKHLAQIFQIIVEQVPTASLIITCDKTLWGLDAPGNEEEQELFDGIPNVKFLGNVPREELIKYQKTSEMMVFPCTYNELFCISAIECQAAGCAIVSNNIAAMPETVPVGYVGNLFDGYPSDEVYQQDFAQYVIGLLTDSRATLEVFQEQARERALQIYTWSDIIYEWSFYIDTILRLK